MGVELWSINASTPSLALPLQGGGDAAMPKGLSGLILALLQHGKNQHVSAKLFCELPGAVNHEFGNYLSLALTTNLGVIVPDRLDQIYTGDIRSLCEVAWNNFDKPIDLKFFERVKLIVGLILK
ncbi:MAG: hypothetical protein PHP70_10945 [Gallionella sp.]|nr:hypothetical protein [Gallionella sp.]